MLDAANDGLSINSNSSSVNITYNSLNQGCGGFYSLLDWTGTNADSAYYWFDSANAWRLTGVGDGLTFGGHDLASYIFNLAQNEGFNAIVNFGSIQSDGNFGSFQFSTDGSGNITATTVTTSGYVVADLPAGTEGQQTYVTDAASPAYLQPVTGGGSTVCPVFFDGTNWVCH